MATIIFSLRFQFSCATINSTKLSFKLIHLVAIAIKNRTQTRMHVFHLRRWLFPFRCTKIALINPLSEFFGVHITLNWSESFIQPIAPLYHTLHTEQLLNPNAGICFFHFSHSSDCIRYISIKLYVDFYCYYCWQRINTYLEKRRIKKQIMSLTIQLLFHCAIRDVKTQMPTTCDSV